MTNDVIKIIKKHGLTQFKILNYKQEYIKFNPYNIKNLPENAKSILCFAIPYYSHKLNIENKNKERNISVYAAVPDYHRVISGIFDRLILDFKEIFKKNGDSDVKFAGYTDNSPFNELQVGLLSGLGVLGRNQLILNEKYGSYIFLGIIVTDFLLEETKKPKNHNCSNCGRCIKACPTGALGEKGLKASLCLSFITQKKGELTKQEEEFIKKSEILWGCDICQTVCPYNKGLIETNILEFKEDIIKALDYKVLEDDYKKRAFGFRGEKVLRRNLDLFYKSLGTLD